MLRTALGSDLSGLRSKIQGCTLQLSWVSVLRFQKIALLAHNASTYQTLVMEGMFASWLACVRVCVRGCVSVQVSPALLGLALSNLLQLTGIMQWFVRQSAEVGVTHTHVCTHTHTCTHAQEQNAAS